MTLSSSNKLRSIVCATALIVAAASSGAVAATGPVKVAVGNGAPLAGSSSSKVGVGVLTPQRNGTPTSVRVLGTEKTAGVYASSVKGPNGQPTQAQVMTPVDGIANSHLHK